MKVLLETYNTFAQNVGSGVKTRIFSFHRALTELGIQVDYFDKWHTEIIDYDIIHVFKATLDDYNLMYFAKSLGKKIVLSSIIPLSDEKKIVLNRYARRILPIHTLYEITERCLKLADSIVTESETESRFIQKYYNVSPSKITALPNGINSLISDGNPEIIRKELPFKGDFVLQVGRIDHNKNQLNTIRALKGSGIPLVIVGGPAPQEIDYYRQCLREADNNVYFIGWISLDDPRLASVYAAAKVLVLSSIHETFGNVIVEGGINDCILACSDNLPISNWEVIRPYISYFNPSSIKDMKKVISDVFNYSVPSGQSELFKEFFSWKRIAEEHIKIYESLLS